MPRILAIELNETDAKVFQLNASRKTGIQLETAFRVPFEPSAKPEDAPRERGARLKDALRAHKTQADDVALVVPKQSATVRRVRLPSNDPAEIASMARFEAEKLIPFNVERHIIAHGFVKSRGLEGSDVLLAAIDQVVMDPLIQTLSAAGLAPAVADVSALAIAYAAGRHLDAPSAQQCHALVQVGWTHTDIAIFDAGEMVTTRSVLHGVHNLVKDLAQAMGLPKTPGVEALLEIDALHPEAYRSGRTAPAPAAGSAEFQILETGPGDNSGRDPAPVIEAWIQKLVTNVRRTYEFVLREYSIPPLKRVYLTGEGALLKDLSQAVEMQLGVSVSIFNPLAGVPRAEKTDLDERMLVAYVCSYGSALRLAEEGPENGINLLPSALIEKRRQSDLMIHYASAGAMALVGVLMIVLLMWNSGRRHTEVYDRLSEYTQDLNGLVLSIDDMRNRIKVIRDIKLERAGALQIMEGISQYEPIGPSTAGGRITLTDFDFTLGVEVRLKGYALEIEDINKFVYYLKTLRNAKNQEMFETVDAPTQSPTGLPRRTQTVYSFEIVAIPVLEN